MLEGSARNRRRWDSLSECTISYTTTCVTFIDRFTIGKEKCSVLIKLVFYKLQSDRSPPPAAAAFSPRCGAERSLPGRCCQDCPLSTHSAAECGTTLTPGQRRSSALVFFTHLHPLHLPLHQKGTYKGGSVGSGPATSPPCG